MYQAWKAFNQSSVYIYEDTWESSISTGWLAYEFSTAQIIEKYTIKNITPTVDNRAPKNWTFEAWDEQTESWVVLDKREDEVGWTSGEKREFTFNNTTPYKKYRINVTANNGGIYVSIDELEMMSKTSTVPDTPTDSEPSGNAILEITLQNGVVKEYDLTMSEVTRFISWYEAKASGSGTVSFPINKGMNNKGPFKSRTDYILFDKIIEFEVSEY